jgi:hypothetical protein
MLQHLDLVGGHPCLLYGGAVDRSIFVLMEKLILGDHILTLLSEMPYEGALGLHNVVSIDLGPPGFSLNGDQPMTVRCG